MQQIKTDTEGAFDNFIEEQRRLTHQLHDSVDVTLYQFDKAEGAPILELVYRERALEQVPLLRLQPRGMTPLNDAVGMAIANTIRDTGVDSRVVFVIMTDGEENASREYKTNDIKHLVTKQRNAGWEFVFLGVGIDGFAVGGSYGIDRGHTVSETADSAGTQVAFAAAGQSVNAYRTSVSKGEPVTLPDLSEKKEDEDK